MRRAISPFLLLFCVLSAQAENLFLGPIPVQFTPARSTVVLDLHRFYQPSDTSKFKVGNAPGVQTSFDRSTLQLQVSLDTSARGLIDLPFKISNGGKANSRLGRAPGGG